MPRHASETRRCCAPRRSTRTSHGGCAARARAGSPRSTRCCRAAHPSASAARSRTASPRGARRRSSVSSAVPCAPCATCERWGSVRSSSTATSSRRMAAPARRRSAVATWPCTMRSRAWCSRAPSRLTPSRRSAPRSRSGIVDGVPLLDLPYVEDSRAEVDMNVVMTRLGGFVEVQGTAEGAPVQPRRARHAAGTGRGGHRRDHRPPAGDGERAAGRSRDAGPAGHRQRPQGRGGPGDPRPVGGGRGSRHRRRGDRRHLRGERPAQGPRPGRGHR